MSSNYTGKAYDIMVSSTDPNIVVTSFGNNIYRTTDGGLAWTSILTGLPNYMVGDSSF